MAAFTETPGQGKLEPFQPMETFGEDLRVFCNVRSFMRHLAVDGDSKFLCGRRLDVEGSKPTSAEGGAPGQPCCSSCMAAAKRRSAAPCSPSSAGSSSRR